jgi:ribosomal protein L35
MSFVVARVIAARASQQALRAAYRIPSAIAQTQPVPFIPVIAARTLTTSGMGSLRRSELSAVGSISKLLFQRGPLHLLTQSCGVKTKSAAKKRFIRTGNGLLKHGRPGKRHLTGKKSRTVTMRMNQKMFITGRMKKNMDMLISR